MVMLLQKSAVVVEGERLAGLVGTLVILEATVDGVDSQSSALI
jgi:hypothetical protein